MKVRKMSPPSIDEIQTEAAWIDEMIKRVSERSHSSDCSLKQFLHLEVCRAELRAYLAGLLFAIGYPDLLDHHRILYELNLSDPEEDHCSGGL